MGVDVPGYDGMSYKYNPRLVTVANTVSRVLAWPATARVARSD